MYSLIQCYINYYDNTVDYSTVLPNLFIYQARESSLVPAGFLTAQFLHKLLIYEAFVVEGKLGLRLPEGKGKYRQVHSSSFQASIHFPFPPGKQCREPSS